MSQLLLSLLFTVLLGTSLSQVEIPKKAKHDFSYYPNHCSVGINDMIRGCAILHYEHVFFERFGLELGSGLTFDDWYALQFWDGPQYVRRDKNRDTRFTHSLTLRFVPFRKYSFFYFGAGTIYRKFYSANQDKFFDYNGWWVGSRRKEWNYKLIAGNFFNLYEHFTLDYYLGLGVRTEHDEWSFDHKNIMGQTYFERGETKKSHLQFYLGLKLGFSF